VWGQTGYVFGISSGLGSGSKSIYEIAFLHGESMWAFTLFFYLFFPLPFPTFSFSDEVMFSRAKRENCQVLFLFGGVWVLNY